jgi:TrwC relaxase/AAA domain/CHC2 zinc finger
MMGFAKIAGGSPSSMGAMTKHMLTQSVPKEVADLSRYYTRENELGENEARLRRDMHPLVAKGLGVDPEKPVGMDEINALLAGRRADGEKIEGKEYSELREYKDPKTGETKTKVPIGSVDFCMTPDKSVSVAWAFSSPAEQAAIYQAHSDAANATMAYVETHMAKASRGKGGSKGYDQGHIGWIEFNHYTSRPTIDIVTQENGQNITERVIIDVPGDMDLHRHVTVPNAVFCENGRVGSMDLDRLNGFVKESGALYQAHLATNLRKLGADVILDPDTGAARLTVIPDEIRTHFSKRTARGEDAAREYAQKEGLDWDSLSDNRKMRLMKKSVQGISPGLDDATLAKLKKDDMADFSAWKQQATELNWSFDTIVKKHDGPEISIGPHPAINPEIRHEIAHPVASEWLEKELNKRAVLSEHDIRTAAARSLIHSGIDSHKDIDGVVGKMMEKGVSQYGEKTFLIAGQETGKWVRSFTTALHERDENEFISKAKRASENPMKALDRDRLKAAVERSGLKFEGEHGEAQLKAIHQIGEGGALSVLVGAAGSGKTALLTPLIDAWKEDGRRVYGMALAWRQADDLIDAGISRDDTKGINDSRAISVFMKDIQSGKIELDHKSVVVVDELSLLGTRQALDLVRLRDKHDFQLVMIGDDRQCQSIEAGPVIDLARKALGPNAIPEILTTLRQKSEREREISGLFRAGEAGPALAMKREDKTVELVQGGPRQAAQRVADLFAERMKENAKNPKYSITVSAPTNSDAHQLSIAIREKRREMGLISKKDLVTIQAAGAGDKTTYEMKLAEGDKVRLFKNVSPLKGRGSLGRNGSIVTVVNADKEGIQLRNADGKEGYVPWERLTQAGKVRLAYGEVMTTHTAQGSTATEHIYAMPQGTKAVNGFSSYSSGTRHEQKSFMVISAGAERADVAAHRPINDPRPIKEDDLWSNAARNLGYQPVKQTATDFLKDAVNVQRASSRAIQRGLQPGELRERQGKQATTVHTRTRQRQEVRTAVQISERVEAMSLDLEPTIENLSHAVSSIAVAVQQTIENIARRPSIDMDVLPSAIQPSIDTLSSRTSHDIRTDPSLAGEREKREAGAPTITSSSQSGKQFDVLPSDLQPSIETRPRSLETIASPQTEISPPAYDKDLHNSVIWPETRKAIEAATTEPKTGKDYQPPYFWPETRKAIDAATTEPKTGKDYQPPYFWPETRKAIEAATTEPKTGKDYQPPHFWPETRKAIEAATTEPKTGKDYQPPYFWPETGKISVGRDFERGTNDDHAPPHFWPETRKAIEAAVMPPSEVAQKPPVSVSPGPSVSVEKPPLPNRTPTALSAWQPLPREKIDELKRSVSLTHLISQKVKLDHHGKGLCEFHEEKTPSFQVNERKGTFHCFACGKHGDAVTWLTDGLRMSFPEALEYLSGKSGIELPKPDITKMAGKEESWVAVLPVPEKAPDLFKSGGWTVPVFNPRAAERSLDRVEKPYKPQHVASYKDADGRQMGYVLRMEMADGTKYTPQVVWAVPNADKDKDPLKVGRWALVTMGDKRPLYRGEEIARNPGKTVVIVMGEKKADSLQASLGKAAVVVSWAGGDNGRFYTDFSALKGRNVIIWPDADAGGKAAAVGEINSRGDVKKGVAEFAREAGATGVKVIVPPEGVAKGWDAGDLIKSGAGTKEVREFITTKAVTVETAKKEFEPAISAAQQKQAQGKTKQVDAPTKQKTAPSQAHRKGPTRTHRGPTIRH